MGHVSQSYFQFSFYFLKNDHVVRLRTFLCVGRSRVEEGDALLKDSLHSCSSHTVAHWGLYNPELLGAALFAGESGLSPSGKSQSTDVNFTPV